MSIVFMSMPSQYKKVFLHLMSKYDTPDKHAWDMMGQHGGIVIVEATLVQNEMIGNNDIVAAFLQIINNIIYVYNWKPRNTTQKMKDCGMYEFECCEREINIIKGMINDRKK